MKTDNTSKENRRRLIDAKLRKIAKSFSKNQSFRHPSQKKFASLNANANKALKDRNNDSRDINESFNGELNMLSQENPEFLSQESQESTQMKEINKPSGFLQGPTGSNMNMKLGQSSTQRLSEMRFIPQQQRSQPNVEAKNTLVETAHVKEKQGFEINLPGNIIINEINGIFFISFISFSSSYYIVPVSIFYFNLLVFSVRSFQFCSHPALICGRP